ncbi:MAG: hypothetical protein QF561_01385 [Phycisphaerales bacterium]|jgi:hypothetical protein|nr:hypothetical protein [Phycisphaerales bacterium]
MQRDAGISPADAPSVNASLFASASLVLASLAWLAGILVPVICFGPLGMSFDHVETAGQDHMGPAQWRVFLVVVILAACGFLAIIGVVLGLLGASIASRARSRAVVGIILNVIAWIGVATFFLAAYGG